MYNLEHSVLFLFLFCFFCILGRYLASIKSKFHFWVLASVPIFFYSIITGTRYGWGTDYLNYKHQLDNVFRYEQDQIGFKWLNQSIISLGFDYVGGFVIYSFIFITSTFVLIRSYKKDSIYMYYFVIPATILFVTNAIRQATALSFVFLGLYFLNKKRWVELFLCIFIGSTIHTSILITTVMIGVVYLFIKHPLNWKITIPIYLFTTFFSNFSGLGIFTTFLAKYVSFDNHFQGYIDNSDIWLGEEAVSDIYQQSTIALLLSSIFYISIIYVGYFALKFKPNPKVGYLYNVVVLGIIFYRFVFLYEILRRIAEPLVMFYFIVLGYSFSVIVEMRKNKTISSHINHYKFDKQLIKSYKFFMGCIVMYLILFYGRFIFFNPEGMFYWNK